MAVTPPIDPTSIVFSEDSDIATTGVVDSIFMVFYYESDSYTLLLCLE